MGWSQSVKEKLRMDWSQLLLGGLCQLMLESGLGQKQWGWEGHRGRTRSGKKEKGVKRHGLKPSHSCPAESKGGIFSRLSMGSLSCVFLVS